MIFPILEAPKRSVRELKGSSMIALLADYIVLDIETTGLDPTYDEIIELAAVRVRNNAIDGTFTSLVKPDYPIDDFISELTGITNDMLCDAPSLSAVLPDFLRFVGNDTLVGHNVNFDINFIYDQAALLSLPPFKNDFIDTMRLSRKLFPDLTNHKLATVSSHLNVPQPAAHRAMADCEVTNSVYQAIAQYVSSSSIDLASRFAPKPYVKAADIHAETDQFDEDSPFYGKVCVFTGALERMVRRDAMQIVANMGGICGDGVTAKTNYLILGNNDYCSSIKDGKSSKQKKAEALILKGKDISIISEDVFYDMISST